MPEFVNQGQMGYEVDPFDINGYSIDSFSELIFRDKINGWADSYVNFYKEAFKKAVQVYGLNSSHVVGDIGSGIGQALDTGLTEYNQELDRTRPGWALLSPRIMGSDPLIEPAAPYKPTSNFELYKAYGEFLPFNDSVFDVTILNRVIYRAFDKEQMLLEAIRTTKPGGLIIITSNGIRHAQERYRFERSANQYAFKRIGWPVQHFKPPAENAYFEYLPRLAKIVGSLEMEEGSLEECVVQDSPVRITEERLPWYLDAMAFSRKRSYLPPFAYKHWREFIYRDVASYIRLMMEPDEYGEISFKDRVNRGMVTFWNRKEE